MPRLLRFTAVLQPWLPKGEKNPDLIAEVVNASRGVLEGIANQRVRFEAPLREVAISILELGYREPKMFWSSVAGPVFS